MSNKLTTVKKLDMDTAESQEKIYLPEYMKEPGPSNWLKVRRIYIYKRL